METFVPQTVRQAKWLIVGGLVLTVMGVLRVVSFFERGGFMVLVMGAAFVALGVVSVVASVIRLRRGETSDDRTP